MTISSGALVILANYAALGVIRSLGRQGIPVWVLSDRWLPATFSRYSHKILPWPNTSFDEQALYLAELATAHDLQGWTLFPTEDSGAALLEHWFSDLSQTYRLAVAPPEISRWATDKRNTYQLADELNIEYPVTFLPRDRDALASLNCSFPVILKPARKLGYNRFEYAKAWRANSRQELLSLYDVACSFVEPELILIQEFIPGGAGDQYSFAALAADGEVRACITTHNKRMFPVDFGRGSTYVQSVQFLDIERSARKWLEAIKYTGLAEIEFKRNPRTGRCQLLDVNGRIWASHSLGQAAGVDFPYLLWLHLHGRSFPTIQSRTGVTWRYLRKDLLAAYGEIRVRRLAVRTYIRSLVPPGTGPLFAPDDPLPALLDLPLCVVNRLTSKRPSGN